MYRSGIGLYERKFENLRIKIIGQFSVEVNLFSSIQKSRVVFPVMGTNWLSDVKES